MIIEIIKDFISPTGREYKEGSKYDCCRSTYKKLLEDGYCNPVKGDKKIKKKVKKTNKIEKDGDIK